MANPQLENGFTRIANETLEEIVRMPLNSTQLKIVLVVWRNTYGFSRKSHGISETFIVKATGISKRYISSELNKLIQSNIITVLKESTFKAPRIIEFNKCFDMWMRRTDIKQVKISSTVELQNNTTGEELFNTTVEESFHQERKNKETIKKDAHSDFFETVWKLYPNKKGKGQVSDTQKAKLLKIGVEHLSRCIERYIKEKPSWQAYQNGSTFFNSGYVDYLDQNYKETPSTPKRKLEIVP